MSIDVLPWCLLGLLWLGLITMIAAQWRLGVVWLTPDHRPIRRADNAVGFWKWLGWQILILIFFTATFSLVLFGDKIPRQHNEPPRDNPPTQRTGSPAPG